MKFTKIHSLGNDFLIIDEGEDHRISEKAVLARKICERHTGVGADGLLLISVSDKKKGLINFRIFNADGTEAEVSGNGLRCAAAYLYYKKMIESPKIIFLTPVGNRACELIDRNDDLFHLKIKMGIPQFKSTEIPFDDGTFHEKIIDYPLSINQKINLVTVVSIGNPHCTIFIDRLPARIEWHQIGREIEYHPFFPKRTNIEFVRVMNRKEIEVFFWERGVGETLSSGSGACAAAVASILKGLTDKKVNVRTTMGNLTVEWEQDEVFQSGPSQIVFEGDFLT
jgi:diaminopimelate epimerase